MRAGMMTVAAAMTAAAGHAQAGLVQFNAPMLSDEAALLSYESYVDAFTQGRLGADFNGDGFVDYFDHDAYVSAFEDGYKPDSSGAAAFTLDTETLTLDWMITATGLSSPAVLTFITLSQDFGGEVIDLAAPGSPFIGFGRILLTADQALALQAGGWTATVATTMFIGGELKSPVIVPAPAAMGLLGLGLVVWGRRRGV